MKEILKVGAAVGIVLLFSFSAAQAATILFPSGGGTGWGTPGGLKAHTVVIGNGLNPVATATPSTAGYVLTSNGVNADPTFQAPTGGGSTFGYPFPNNATTTVLTFTNPPILGSLSGLIAGNSGTLYQVSTTSMNASITGNAGSATILQTARNINGVAFNGSQNITIQAASSSLLGDTNTFSGNDTFSNTITGSISGNAGTATKLATGRTIAITGDLSYTSPSFDGSGNVTAAGTLATVNSNVGSFTNANITVNGKGLITAASNGTAPTTYTGAFPIIVSGSAISFGGLSTSSPIAAGAAVLYATGVNTIASVATSTLASGTGITVSSTGYLVGGSNGTVSLNNTAVSPGSYTNANITVDQQGRITSASNGSSGGGSGNVSTSTHEIANNLAYWTTNSATPALLGQVTAGSNGQVLSLSGGIPTWIASTTYASPLVFANNQVTCATCLTANQNITLSGVVTGSGSTAVTTAFGAQNAGVLGAVVNGNNTSVLATSTLYGVAPAGGYVLGWDNNKNGIGWIATSSSASGVTSLTAGNGLQVSASTGAIIVSEISNIATSTGETAGNLPYWTSTNGNPATLGKVATTTVTAGNGITGSVTTLNSGGATNSLGLATINAGVLGAAINGAVPTSQSTSTLYGAGGIPSSAIANTSVSAGSYTNANITVNAQGQVTSASNGTGGSSVKLPTLIVASSGGDTTSIQTAMTTCGTLGGGNIILTDANYSQGGTGLTFRSSNCHLLGRGIGTTTIAFTGATTLFKTNSPASTYEYDSIEGISVSGDGNTGGVAFDLSDMSSFTLDHTTTDDVGTWIVFNDTQNATFYDVITDNHATTLTKFGVNASSTNPVNGYRFDGNFIGCGANNCIGLNMNNANGVALNNDYFEPDLTKTGVIDVNIFDNTMSTNNGVFNVKFDTDYLEGSNLTGSTGVKIAAAVDPGGGIKRIEFNNVTNENHVTDWSIVTAEVPDVTLINSYDSNFDNPLTTFGITLGVSTSTELQNISAPPYAALAINAVTSKVTNEVVVANSVNNREDFKIDASGNVYLERLGAQSCLGTSATGQIIAGTCSGGAGGIGDPFTHPFLGASATTTQFSIGTSTPNPLAQLTIGTTTTAAGTGQLSLAAGAGNAQYVFTNRGGNFMLSSTTASGFSTTTTPILYVNKTGQIGIGCANISAALGAFGCGTNTLINPGFQFISQTTTGDARIGAASGNFVTGITTGDGSTYGALYAYNYNSSVPENLVLGQFGGNVGIGTTTPQAALAVGAPSATVIPFMVATSTGSGNHTQVFEIDQGGHLITTGPKPACGTGCSFIAGNDEGGNITTTSGASTVTVTFAKSYATTTCTGNANSAIALGVSYTVSGGFTTAFTFTPPSTITGSISYRCDMNTN